MKCTQVADSVFCQWRIMPGDCVISAVHRPPKLKPNSVDPLRRNQFSLLCVMANMLILALFAFAAKSYPRIVSPLVVYTPSLLLGVVGLLFARNQRRFVLVALFFATTAICLSTLFPVNDWEQRLVCAAYVLIATVATIVADRLINRVTRNLQTVGAISDRDSTL